MPIFQAELKRHRENPESRAQNGGENWLFLDSSKVREKIWKSFERRGPDTFAQMYRITEPVAKSWLTVRISHLLF